eukprot:COSAG05_NODE_15923_length_358_cov_0.548263_1_plen_43_part_01
MLLSVISRENTTAGRRVHPYQLKIRSKRAMMWHILSAQLQIVI